MGGGVMDDLRHVLRPIMRYKRDYARSKAIGGGLNWGLIVCIMLCVLFWGFVLSALVQAEEIDLNKIIHIESSGNPLAWRKADDSRGLMQITPIVLKEWNNFHPREKHSANDLWNPAINKKIGSWYMNARIPQLLKHYGKPDTLKNRIISYNAGISYVVKGKAMPEITRSYLAKYKRSGPGPR